MIWVWAGLDWFFPQGLPADEQQLLIDDMAMLTSEPWSIQKCINTVLADWYLEVTKCDLKLG